jgi:hypothetical protein
MRHVILGVVLIGRFIFVPFVLVHGALISGIYPLGDS